MWDFFYRGNNVENNKIKEPISFDLQVEAIKNKGFIVDNKNECKEFLLEANYYRVLAYLLPFKQSDKSYIKEINFKRIQKMYEFDSEIRALLFSTIEHVEFYLRTQFSYYFTMKYGSLGYLKEDNFSEKHNHEKFINKLNEYIEKNQKSPIVKHHKEKYDGKYPLWVIIEYFSISSISYFYADLKTQDKKYLARTLFNTSFECLRNWLICLTGLRNRCAHYARLYYWNFLFKPKQYSTLNYTFDNSLFSQIYLLKQLYPSKEKWENEFLTELEKLINKYGDDISLKHMGFPINWKEILSFQKDLNINHQSILKE